MTSITETKVLEQAALWYLQQEQGDYCAKQQAEFELWLQDQQHQQAWQKITRVTDTFKGLQQQETNRLACATLHSLQQCEQKTTRRTVLKSFAVLAVAGLSWKSSPYLSHFARAHLARYKTDVGQTKSAKLSDGSKVYLNTDTALDENYQVDKRELTLYKGEVYIATAADSDRPFFVSAKLAGEAITYTALGTEFSIVQKSNDSVLSVFKGKVAIDYNKQRLIIHAGQRIKVTQQGFGKLDVASADDLAWQQKELRAKNISLVEFCLQLERYHAVMISLDDSIADLHVMGIFPIFDKNASLAMLAQSLPIDIEQPLPWWLKINAKKLN